MAILPPAALAISFGTVKGEIFGPFSRSLVCCSSISLIPPIPVPTMAPQRKGCSFEKSSPLSLTACIAAATANCVKRSIRLLSRRSMYFVTSKFLISPPNFTGYALTSKDSIVEMPLFPSHNAAKSLSADSPNAVTHPKPVITTRRLFIMLNLTYSLLLALGACNIGNVINRGTDRLDFLGLFVRNTHIKFVFKFHNQLDRIQRVGVQVVNK